MKKAGKGIFAPKTLSAELAAVCGKKVMPRTEVRAAELRNKLAALHEVAQNRLLARKCSTGEVGFCYSCQAYTWTCVLLR